MRTVPAIPRRARVPHRLVGARRQRAADERPHDAAVEAEVARPAWKGVAKAAGMAGHYVLDWSPTAAKTDVVLTVSARGESDLIVIPGVVQDQPAKPSAAAAGPAKRWYYVGGGLAAAALLGLVFLLRRKKRARAAAPAAVVLALSVSALLLPLHVLDVRADEGHPHGDEPPGTPARSVAAGQNVAVPKAAQFTLGIRTMRAKPETVAESVRLVGRVVPDPSAYARIQPSQTSRIWLDPEYPLPTSGQWVKRGQVLAVLEPNLTSIERSEQRAQLFKIEGQITNTERQIERWSRLAPGTVPRKDVETTELELARLKKEKEQLQRHSLGRELLSSPIDGQVSDVHIVAGQVVSAETILMEILDPTKLRVDAVLYDVSLADQIKGGAAATRLFPGKSFRLKLVGVSIRVSANDQGIHVIFDVENPDGLLKLGLPVEVSAEMAKTALAVSVPRGALAEVDGQTVVFVHGAPEQFEVRIVDVGRIVGEVAEIRSGIKPGERVVVQGTLQLANIR